MYKSCISEFERTRSQRCKVGQCRALTNKAERCRACVSPKDLQSNKERMCWRHRDFKKQPGRLNRQGLFLLDLDDALLHDPAKWMADDTVQLAFKIMHREYAKRKNVGLVMMLQANSLVWRSFDSTTADEVQSQICIILFHHHWSTLANRPCRFNNYTKTWFVCDSLLTAPRVYPFEETLRTNLGVQGPLTYLRTVPQQQNNNDCGFFAIYFALCILYDLPMHKTLDGAELRQRLIDCLVCRSFRTLINSH